MSLSLCKKRRKDESGSENVDENEHDTGKPTTSKRLRQEKISAVFSTSQSQTLVSTQSSIRCGKIKRIHLQNFMCHANLSIDFHQRVNFLVGSNGSGKSAIMAALVLGLGSKAKATNRSGSMKQFIRTGESTAKIEITFYNEGPQAYEHERFGDHITVVRNITQGAATYVIKNASGNVVSRKVDDLNRILVYHNMQADNPIFVLNQDSAREFLKELDPHKNYKMFTKATQLEIIMEKLNDCLHSHKDQCIRLQSMRKKITKNAEDLQILNGKLEILNNLENLKGEVKRLEVEKAWILVVELENRIGEVSTNVQKLRDKQEELLSGAGSKSALKDKLKEEISNWNTEKSSKQEIYDAERLIQSELKNKLTTSNQTCQEVNYSIDCYKKKKSSLEANIVEIENYIEQQANTNIDELKRQNAHSLAEHKKSLDELLVMLASTKRDIKIFMDGKAQKEEQSMELRSLKLNHSTNIDRLNSVIASINISSKDKLSSFGNEMVKLVAAVDKFYTDGRFSEKPRGPIGSYIEVPNSKYRDLVETQLGQGLVKAFIVNSAKDRQMLEGIIQRICPQFRCSIITTKFMDRVYNVEDGRVRPVNGTRALINEIRCSDPVVMNCLIDRLQIETILLTESKDIAEQISSQIENVPHNMAKVIVPQHKLEYYPEPKYRMYSLNISPARFIQVDVKERIATLEKEKREIKSKLEDVEKSLSNLKSAIEVDSKRLDDKKKILYQQETKKGELESAILQINEIEYPEHNEINVLKTDLTNMQKQILDIDKSLELKKGKLDDLFREKKTIERKFQEQTKVLQDLQKEVDDVEKNIDATNHKLRKLASTFNENKKKMEQLENEIHILMKKQAEKDVDLKKLVSAASTLGERVETDRDEETISNEIAKIQAKLRQSSNINENVDDLRATILSKRTDLEMEQSVFYKLKASIDTLGKSLRTRFGFVKQLKQHMVLLLQYAFNYLLKARDFLGSVEVNHEQQTLVLSVKPRDKHLDNAMSSTRALSGGERSYSTVAFLVALWSCVDHPFYFLDEYDVFTDVVNRDCLTKLLVNEGKIKPNRQYTFLTPQDMSLASDDIVQIHRLAPPERR